MAGVLIIDEDYFKDKDQRYMKFRISLNQMLLEAHNHQVALTIIILVNDSALNSLAQYRLDTYVSTVYGMYSVFSKKTSLSDYHHQLKETFDSSGDIMTIYFLSPDKNLLDQARPLACQARNPLNADGSFCYDEKVMREDFLGWCMRVKKLECVTALRRGKYPHLFNRTIENKEEESCCQKPEL